MVGFLFAYLYENSKGHVKALKYNALSRESSFDVKAWNDALKAMSRERYGGKELLH